MSSCYNSLTLGNRTKNGGRIFLRQLVDGKMQAFVWYPKLLPENAPESFYVVFQKNGFDYPFHPDMNFYWAELRKYMEECPAVTQKIDNDEYKGRSKEHIAEDY